MKKVMGEMPSSEGSSGQEHPVKLTRYQAELLGYVMGVEQILALDDLPPAMQFRSLLNAVVVHLNALRNAAESRSAEASARRELADVPTREIMRILARRMLGEDWRAIWLPRLKAVGAYAMVLGVVGRRALRRKAAPKA